MPASKFTFAPAVDGGSPWVFYHDAATGVLQPTVLAVDVSGDPIGTVANPIVVSGTVTAIVPNPLPVSQSGAWTVSQGTSPWVTSSTTGVVSTVNSTAVPLGGGATFTGAWEDVAAYGSITVSAVTDVSGSLYADFSSDGATVDRAVLLSTGTSLGIHGLTPVFRYMRVRVVNDATPQSYLRMQTIYNLAARISIPTSRMAQSLNDYADVINTRAAIVGQQPGGVYANVPVDTQNHLQVAVHSPITPFGEVNVAEATPIAQVDFIWGVPTSSYLQTTTTLSGTITGANGLLLVASGVTAGALADARTKRVLKYRDGQAAQVQWSCAFSTGIANNVQLVGPQTSENGVGVGYNGTALSVFLKQGGIREIQTLTITAGTVGAGNVTVTVNGTAVVVALGAGLSTTQVASVVAATDYTASGGGFTAVSAGADVTFVAYGAGNLAGAFTYAGGGTGSTGTFAETRAGAAGTDTWVAQASWNIDPLDGTGPSGFTLVPTNLNAYAVDFTVDSAVLFVRSTTNSTTFVPFHKFSADNTSAAVLFQNPILQLHAISYNTAGTAGTTVSVASMSLLLSGILRRVGARRGITATQTGVGTSFVPMMSVGQRNAYGTPTRAYNAEALLLYVTGAADTANRAAEVALVLNATLTGSAWTAVDATSTMRQDTAATAYTGGTQIFSFVTGVGASAQVNLEPFDIILLPEDTLTIVARAVASTSDINVSLAWVEDR